MNRQTKSLFGNHPAKKRALPRIVICVLAVLVLAVPAISSSDDAAGSQAQPSPSASSSPRVAAEPHLWVDNHECDPPGGRYDVSKRLPGDYPATATGLMQFLNDWANAPDQSWHLAIQAKTVIHGEPDTKWSDVWHPAPGGSQKALVVWPIKKGHVTKCAVVESSTPLTAGQTACSHGITDGTGGVGDHGIRNPGCDGHYKNPDGSVGEDDKSKMWTLQIDSWENSTHLMAAPYGSNHIVFRDMEATEAPGINQSNHGSITNALIFLNGNDVGLDRFYLHGWDPGDPGQPAGPCKLWNMTGLVNVTNGSSTVEWAKGVQFGAPFNPATTTINGVNYKPNQTIVIADTPYTIASVQSSTSLTLTTKFTGATSDSAPFTFKATQWHPYENANGCGDDLGRAIMWNGQNFWIMNGYIEKVHGFQTETHAISGGRDFGPGKIVHNWIEGGSVSFFVGGFPVQNCLVGGKPAPVSQCTIEGNPNVGPPADLEIRRNRFDKDANWRWLTGANPASPGPGNFTDGVGCNFTGGRRAGPFTIAGGCPFEWEIKNNFELKLGSRILADGNVFENDWPDGQLGGQVVLNPRTCSGGAACGQFDAQKTPVTFVNDIRMTNSIFRNATYTDNPGARSGSRGNGGGVSQGGNRWYWVNNVYYEIGDSANWGGANGKFDHGAAMYWGVGGGNSWQDCVMSTANGISTAQCPIPAINARYKTLTHSGTTVTMSMGVRLDPVTGSNITISDESVDPAYNGTWKILSQTSQSVDYTPTEITFKVNTAPSQDCRARACTGSVNLSSYAYGETNISPGDYVLVSKCANRDGSGQSPASEYNSPQPPQQIIACNGSDCPANDPTTLTVRFLNPKKLSNDNSGVTCTIGNKRGWQKNETWSHNTVAGVDVQNFFDPGAFPQNAILTDNIFGYATGSNLYCRTGKGPKAVNCLDTNTLTFHHNVFPGFPPDDWVAYPRGAGGKFCSSQGVPGLCFPSAISCRSGTVSVNGSGDPACIGWTGFLNGAAYPPAPASFLSPPYGTFDYHKFVLHSSSPFRAGGRNQASDGTDVGADVSKIDNALTRTTYVCDNRGGDCTQNGKVHGPYHD